MANIVASSLQTSIGSIKHGKLWHHIIIPHMIFARTHALQSFQAKSSRLWTVEGVSIREGMILTPDLCSTHSPLVAYRWRHFVLLTWRELRFKGACYLADLNQWAERPRRRLFFIILYHHETNISSQNILMCLGSSLIGLPALSFSRRTGRQLSVPRFYCHGCNRLSRVIHLMLLRQSSYFTSGQAFIEAW